MKPKNIPVLLFILIFTGVILLGSTQVRATCGDCSQTDIDNNECIRAFGYAIRIYPETNVWPIPQADGTLQFRYQACPYDLAACKRKTWNFFVQDMTSCTGGVVDYIVDTDPPGAQLLLPGNTVPKCTWFTASPGHNLMKLNPSLTCKSGAEVVFSFYAEPGTPTSFCNYSVVTTKSGCEGGHLLGPGCGVAGFVEERTFFCGEDAIIVQFDECSGEPTDVLMPGYTVCATTVGDDDYPTLPEDDPYTPKHMGPGGVGAVFCMDPPPPIYFYNQNAWYGITSGSCP